MCASLFLSSFCHWFYRYRFLHLNSSPYVFNSHLSMPAGSMCLCSRPNLVPELRKAGTVAVLCVARCEKSAVVLSVLGQDQAVPGLVLGARGPTVPPRGQLEGQGPTLGIYICWDARNLCVCVVVV